MGIATEKWSDKNRFNQTGYSAKTLFPVRENYENNIFYEEDIRKAEYREESHQEFLEEMRCDAAEERWCDEHKHECEGDENG